METTALIDPAPRTFFGVPALRDLGRLDAQVAFLGVPYDGGTPQPGIATGQRAGPAAAREACAAQFYYPSRTVAGDRGAEGWYDVEIFSDNGMFGDAFDDSLWDVEAGELARRAVESLERAWEAR